MPDKRSTRVNHLPLNQRQNSGCFNNSNLTNQIARDLGLRIVIGEFSDSNSLPSQKKLCHEYGVSLITIREATKMLQAKRMVYSHMSQGHKIELEEDWNLLDPDILHWLSKRDFTTELLRELNEVRAAIEPIAASAACKSSDEEIFKLETIFKEIQISNKNGINSLDIEIDFHTFILHRNKNRLFRQLSPLVKYAHKYYHRSPNRIREPNESVKTKLYELLFHAIQAKRPIDAFNSMKQLLDHIGRSHF